jgi:hypothetical protein
VSIALGSLETSALLVLLVPSEADETVSVKVHFVNAASEGAVNEAVGDEPPLRVTVGPEIWDQLYFRSPAGKVEELSALPDNVTTTPGRVF